MKLILLISLLHVFSFSGGVDQRLERMMERQKSAELKGVQGFVFQHKLTPPEELFKKDTTVVMKTMAVPEYPAALRRSPQLVGNNNNVNVELYRDILELNVKVGKLESTIDRLSEVTEKVQDSSIDNREFLLKCIEVMLTAIVGGGGLVGGFLAFLKKRKKA